jgi:hypothetical protein
MGNYATQPDFATIASTVTKSDTTFLNGTALYVGTGGDVHVIMNNVENIAGNVIIFKNVPDGSFLPAIVDYVRAATTAADIVAIK